MDAEPRTLAERIEALKQTDSLAATYPPADAWNRALDAAIALVREAEARADTGLDALRALSEAATPGPWVADVPGFGTIFAAERIETRRDEEWLYDVREATNADSALVVAAVNYVRSRLGEGRE